MTWEWVGLILGVLFVVLGNLTLMIRAVSPKR